jgi:undecaprenyl diphosphate synthase
LSYGGRAEILAACNQAIAAGAPVDEKSFSQYLQTADMPDPDLIIRTSGEQRLSNFLPWQSVYSELFFTDTYWPAFTKEEFTRIVGQYGDRQRRRGK